MSQYENYLLGMERKGIPRACWPVVQHEWPATGSVKETVSKKKKKQGGE